MSQNISSTSYFKDQTNTIHELQLDFSPDGWWFAIQEFFTISLKWANENINSAVLGKETKIPIFTNAESYSFKNPLRVSGATLTVTADKDTMQYIYDSPMEDLSFDFIIDITSNIISHRRSAIGYSEYYQFRNSTDLYPQIDQRGLIYSNALNMFLLDNIWTGSVFDDKLYGYEGNDTIYGRDGNDYIVGGEGNDAMFGDNGEDTLFGESGDDIIYGGDGNDTLWGREGNDIIHGGLGVDTSAHSNNSLDFLMNLRSN